MLTNPSPILYQNLMMAMKSAPKQDTKPKMGLLGPKNKPEEKMQDINMPVNRVATYVDAIKAKREEIKNA